MVQTIVEELRKEVDALELLLKPLLKSPDLEAFVKANGMSPWSTVDLCDSTFTFKSLSHIVSLFAAS